MRGVALMEHLCQWDMSTFPSDGFLLEFDAVQCCGNLAPIKLDDEEFDIWACAEHYDYYMERP
jgi:hypothetical protein